MLTVAIILSLELYVLDKESPPYFRGLAWAVLVMVFCCLRVDDLQGVLPATMSLTTLGFRAVLGRTKTTGTDRRNHEVSIFIERSVSLSGSDWLGKDLSFGKSGRLLAISCCLAQRQIGVNPLLPMPRPRRLPFIFGSCFRS